MGYIRFVLSKRVTGDDGGATNAVISRIESDMADTGMARDEPDNARPCRAWRQGY